MKPIDITLRLDCRDDVPATVIEWMAANLAEHAADEFDDGYDPAFGNGYEGPPLAGDVTVVQTSVLPIVVSVAKIADEVLLSALDTWTDAQVTTALAEIAEVRYVWDRFELSDNVRLSQQSIRQLDAATCALLGRRMALRTGRDRAPLRPVD